MIAYDTNVLIYALEGTHPWADSAQEVVRLGERDGARLSLLVWQELMTGTILRGNGSETLVEHVLGQLNATEFVPVTSAICQRAVDLTKKFGRQVFGYDAIVLATALEHHVSEFVTNDEILLSLTINGLIIRGL